MPLILVLAACAGSRGAVTIGAAGPWKQGYGAMDRHGVELAAGEINAHGGVSGRPLEVIYRDDEEDGAKAAQVAAAFVADARVLGVVGHVTSKAMLSASRVYDGHLAAIATGVTSPDFSGISPWAFRVISSDSVNGAALAHFASRLGRRRAVLLYENDQYGRGLVDAFRRSFDGEIVSIDPIAEDETDVEPFVSFYRTLHPDVVFVASNETAGRALLREARRQQLHADFIGGDGWTGVVTDTASAEGAYVGAPFSVEDPRPEAQHFVRAYRARFHAEPDGNAALAYDATMLLARAIAERGASRQGVRAYLAGLDAARAYRGATGPIRFLQSGDIVGRSLVVTRVHAGSLLVQAAQ